MSDVTVQRTSRQRTSLNVTRRIFAMLVVLTTLVGVLRAGARYFYCPMMGEVVAEDCCAASKTARGTKTPAFETPDCCQAKFVDALPAGDAFAPSTEIAAAPLTALVQPVPHATVLTALPPHLFRQTLQRAGPPTPTGPQRVARLQVFLI